MNIFPKWKNRKEGFNFLKGIRLRSENVAKFPQRKFI